MYRITHRGIVIEYDAARCRYWDVTRQRPGHASHQTIFNLFKPESHFNARYDLAFLFRMTGLRKNWYVRRHESEMGSVLCFGLWYRRRHKPDGKQWSPFWCTSPRFQLDQYEDGTWLATDNSADYDDDTGTHIERELGTFPTVIDAMFAVLKYELENEKSARAEMIHERRLNL